MKKILFTINLIAIALATSAQQKVVEADGKKPAWAKNLMETGYIIAQGEGASLNEAQQEALLLVKQEIVRSVAEQIISVSTRSLQEDGKHVTEAYSQSVTAKASKVPFLQGISVSKVENSYWEKLRDKPSKKEFYRYYVKYPFSAAQLGRLVAEFKEEDQKITQRINDLEASLSQVESVEQIDAAVDELGRLTLSIEDNRKEKAALLQSRYRALYESISLVEVEHTLGKIVYRLMLGEQPLKTSRKPQAKSACASITQISIGDALSITYRYDGCYADIENFIDVLYRFGNKAVSHKFLIPLA
ncbi:MAG: LPP20 family lipoprotein [Prevotellaceae bacterium]|nr:LPP20 family lipoprotein [Prevotellaceae bacterium]